MPIDLAAPFPTTDNGRILERLATAERRLSALEGAGTIQRVDVAPTDPARDGTPAVLAAPARLYLYVDGVWRYTALT